MRIEQVDFDHPAAAVLRLAQRDEIAERYGTRDSEAEVKRMFVAPQHRGTGVSTAILERLEVFGRERGYARLVLETGDRQPDAIRFYTREGYERIANFGYYADSAASLCFAKQL